MAEENGLLLSRANAAVLSRDYELAARLYKQVIADDPTNEALLAELGTVYIKAGADAQALPVYEKIIQLNPNNVNAFITMGGIYRRLKRYIESVAVLEKARAIDSNNPQISYNLGFTYKSMGKSDEAIACFEAVIDQNPADVLTYNHIGSIYAEQGDHKKAITSYQRGLKIDSNHPILQLNLAKSYEAVGETDKALTAYASSLRSRPGWLEAVEGYSDMLLRHDHVREAFDVLRNALELNPKNAKMHTQLGRVYSRQHIFADAKKEYTTALTYDEDYDPALLGLAETQENLSEFSDAVKTIQRAERRKPNDVTIKQRAAHIMLSANEYSAAFERISQLREQNPKDVQAISLLGQYYICNGDWEKVEDCYAQIADYDPNYSAHYREGAKRFQQKGDTARAEKYLRKAIEKNPRDASAMISLASLLEERSQGDAAFSLYQQASSVDSFNVLSKNGMRRLQESVDSMDSIDAPLYQPSVQVTTKQPTLIEPDIEPEEPELPLQPMSAASDEPPESETENKPAAVTDPFDEDWFERAADGSLVPVPKPASADDAAAVEPDAVSLDALTADEDAEAALFGDEPPLDGSLSEQEQHALWDVADELDDASVADTLVEPTASGTDSVTAELDAAPATERAPETPAPAGQPFGAQQPMPFTGTMPATVFVPVAPQPPVPEPSAPPASAEDIASLEETIRVVNDSAKKAEQAAAQAWEAALVAADTAQALTEALNDREGTGAASADEPPAPDDDYAAYDALVMQENADADTDGASSDESSSEEADSTEAASDDSAQKAASTESAATQTDAAATNAADAKESVAMPFSAREATFGEPCTVPDESSLALFSLLRSLCEFLPQEHYDRFMSSRTRLLLDYVISRLSGNAGLLQRASAHREALPPAEKEAAAAIVPDFGRIVSEKEEASEEEGIQLVTHVVDDLFSLIAAVPDANLRTAMDNATKELVEKLIQQ